MEKAIAWSDLTGTERPSKPWLNGLPRVIFINNLSDGFCQDVDPFGWLWPHLEEIEASPHIYLLLTKWPQRMREFFVSVGYVPDNVHLGVSVENQWSMWRIEELMKCPAALRFVSLEPLLGAVDLGFGPQQDCLWCGGQGWWVPVGGGRPSVVCRCMTRNKYLNRVIVGSESGQNRRPAKLDWIRDLRDQCIAAGIPFFLKQMEVDGKLQKMPLLDGVQHEEYPQRAKLDKPVKAW